MDTRRRAACDLVRALSKSFEGPVITNFSQYVETMLTVSLPFMFKLTEKRKFSVNGTKSPEAKTLPLATSLLQILIPQGADCAISRVEF